MTINPVNPGGWGVNYTPRNTELTQIDQRLAQFGTDKTSGDTFTGLISVNGTITVAATMTIGNPASRFYTTTGGRIILSDSDNITFSPARTRTVTMSMLEHVVNYGTDLYNVDPGTGGLSNSQATSGSVFTIPITKPHDGATINSASVYFTVYTGGTITNPGTTPSITVGRQTLTTGAITSLGSASLAAQPSYQAYQNGGLPWTLTVTGLTNNVVDANLYTYFVQIVDDSNSAATSHNNYIAVSVNYTVINDTGFPQ